MPLYYPHLAGSNRMRQLWQPKTIYDPDTDTYSIDRRVRALAYFDGSVYHALFAEQCPAPSAAALIVDTYPTDVDPYFHFHLLGVDGTHYDQSVSLSIIRRSTGVAADDDGTKWLSAGPAEWYDVTVRITNNKALDLPSLFNGEQQASDEASSTISYQDPRDEV